MDIAFQLTLTNLRTVLLIWTTWTEYLNPLLSAFSEYKSSILEEKKKKENFRMKKAEDLVQKKRNRLDK
jgi:hypothetical protein